MRPQTALSMVFAGLLIASTFTGCERGGDSAHEADPETREVSEQADDNNPDDNKPDPDKPSSKPGPAPTPPETPDPLVDALEAPADAVTSEGRFEALMERGLVDHMPEIGILYGAAGIDQPGVRVAVAADGRGRWAVGTKSYWEELDASGDFELGNEESTKLAEIVEKAWSDEVEFRPSSVEQTRVIILRDGDTARVFEHSDIPPSLEPLEDMLLGHVPDRPDP